MSKIAALMAVEAASLAVMASPHLGGRLNGTKPFEPTRAGIAEVIIGVVLAAGAVALLRARPRAWSVAVVANIFAVAGFAAGLTRTVQGGGALDIGYHLTVLPLFLLTLVVLARARPSGRASAGMHPAQAEARDAPGA